MSLVSAQWLSLLLVLQQLINTCESPAFHRVARAAPPTDGNETFVIEMVEIFIDDDAHEDGKLNKQYIVLI
jgi:hypothetical protein